MAHFQEAFTMQIIVHFRKTTVLQYSEVPCGATIRKSIMQEENVPSDCFHMHVDGRPLADDDILSPSSSLIVRASMRLKGGKGGFGAMLKTMARSSGNKKTTDFGACRDLSGRRLRHVNDEIILKKWQEAKDRGDEFDVSENTQTGVNLWFLSAPSWAEGYNKSNARKRYMKGRTKTRMCLEWLRAREDGQEPPRRAPVWWGCPRGPRCEFAHGEDELLGEGKKNCELQKQQEKKEAAQVKKDAYMKSVDSNDSCAGMESMVLAGLEKKKGGARRRKDDRENELSDVAEEPLSHGGERRDQMEQEPQEADVDDLHPPSWLHPAPSSSSVTKIFSEGVVECTQGFGTVQVSGLPQDFQEQQAGGGKQKPRNLKKGLYYEVDLITGGLMQIGWADRQFSTTPSGGDDESDGGAGENGVGDDIYSWAYDGFRQMIWNGSDAQYPKTKRGKRKGGHDGSGIWKSGDTVGCLLEIDEEEKTGVMSFQLNGCDLGVAFDSNSCEQLRKSVHELLCPEENKLPSIFPAVSLEEGQRAGINIGQRPFKYSSSVTRGVVSVFSLMSEEVAEAEAVEKDGGDSCGSSKTDSGQSSLATTEVFEPIDLTSPTYSSCSKLADKGMSHLKAELAKRGLKVGGTLDQRAERLWEIRQLEMEGGDVEIPKRLLAKKGA